MYVYKYCLCWISTVTNSQGKYFDLLNVVWLNVQIRPVIADLFTFCIDF